MNASLQRAADRQEICMLLAHIAHLADEGSPEDYAACFTRDAVWHLTDATDLPLEPQRIEGREAILAGVRTRRAAGIQGPGSATRHDVSSIVVDVDGDLAAARSYFRYYVEADAQPRLIAMGVYEDALCRTDGRWLVRRRIIQRG